ncbi:hypothetical protein DY000_02013217 [Brassica cretica]|uniref:RNase H type-1 domain-containing protein n=1 Tax=Brassica cretica TaxID=69181 RepID=A0ABQ7CZ10_BRACR|nr:hypothetical protein DY000_02013217 [Brassica cretica]
MIFYGPVKETRRIISSFGLTIRRIGIWTVIDVGTLVRFDWDFDRGNVVGSFNFRRFGFTEVLDLGSSDQYKWSLVFTLWSITLISSFSSFYAKHQSWVFVLFSMTQGQLIGNSGDMKSGEGILIFMDQDLLVVRSSQKVMASGFYAGSVVWIVLEMLWYLGSEFKIGVLWLVEDSVMVCEIWLLEDIRLLKRSFHNSDIVHVPRTENLRADSLARSARKQTSFVVHMDAELPIWFTESI